MTLRSNKILEDISGYQLKVDALQKKVEDYIQQGGEHYKQFSSKLSQEASDIIDELMGSEMFQTYMRLYIKHHI